MIGGGIRGAEDLLDLFEAMVNLVRRFDCLGSKDKQLIAFVGDHGTTADAAAG